MTHDIDRTLRNSERAIWFAAGMIFASTLIGAWLFALSLVRG